MEPGNGILSKAYRVSYALFRLAGTLPERSFRTHLEDKGLDLIVAALEEKQAVLQRTVRTAEYLIRFLRDTGHVHVHTADLLLKEVADLEVSVAGSPAGPTAIPEADLFPEVSRQAPLDWDQDKREEQKKGPARSSLEDRDAMKVVTANYGPALAMRQPGVKSNDEIPGSTGLTINRRARNDRKEQILEKIRQSGNLPDGCRLKDIQEALQNVSERTLRYDLQRLIEDGSVIRQGSGGPATYYRIRV